jgi:hypothetical protein
MAYLKVQKINLCKTWVSCFLDKNEVIRKFSYYKSKLYRFHDFFLILKNYAMKTNVELV